MMPLHLYYLSAVHRQVIITILPRVIPQDPSLSRRYASCSLHTARLVFHRQKEETHRQGPEVLCKALAATGSRVGSLHIPPSCPLASSCLGLCMAPWWVPSLGRHMAAAIRDLAHFQPPSNHTQEEGKFQPRPPLPARSHPNK